MIAGAGEAYSEGAINFFRRGVSSMNAPETIVSGALISLQRKTLLIVAGGVS